MSKAIRAFFGTMSNGEQREAAQRADGLWFQRFYGFNGYAKAWSKWQQFDPIWVEKSYNQYTGEAILHLPESVMSCGFGRMQEITGKLTFRLPA